MKPRTLTFLRSFGKFGAIGAGVAASITATIAVVKAAASSSEDPCAPNPCCPQQRHLYIPEADHPPFRKWNFNWDRMEPGKSGAVWPVSKSEEQDSNLTSEKCSKDSKDDYPIKTRRNLILIRHGQYNTDGEDDCKHTLTELGQEQAAITGKKLASMGIKFTSITSSAMTRAIQTANIILENMDVENKSLRLDINDPLLSEGTPCIPEPPYIKPEVWNPQERDILVDGARIETGFRKYFHRAEPSQQEDSWEIIVCHGNVIRYFICRALQFPPEGWLRIAIDHCSLTRVIVIPTGEVILRGLGDSGHIPYEKATVL